MSNKNGGIFSYTHFNNKLVSVVIITCQTDFAANTDLFKQTGEDLARHIACSEVVSLDDLLQEVSVITDEPISSVVDNLSKQLKEKVEIVNFYKFTL